MKKKEAGNTIISSIKMILKYYREADNLYSPTLVCTALISDIKLMNDFYLLNKSLSNLSE